jgi:hypothetical protein
VKFGDPIGRPITDVIEELEKEIIIEITNSDTTKNKEVIVPVENSAEILVKAFLRLNALEKVRIAKNLGMDIDGVQKMKLPDLDKHIFLFAKEKKLMHQLWDAVHGTIPFANPNNPF